MDYLNRLDSETQSLVQKGRAWFRSREEVPLFSVCKQEGRLGPMEGASGHEIGSVYDGARVLLAQC
jgi:hypothetical protein